jgi:hypothetical protein
MEATMKVWIVFERWDYEGDEVRGVYASERSADDECVALTGTEHARHGRASYHVREFEVIVVEVAR